MIGQSPPDRHLPHSPEAEQGVLACCLLDPATCVGRCITDLKAGGDEFHDLRHQSIFQAMKDMFEDNEPLDVITLQQRLKDNQLLEQCGGISYLAQLPETVPSASNLPTYLEVVRSKHMLREMIRACTETVGRIYDYEGDVNSVLDEAERAVLAVRQLRGESQEFSAKELVYRAIDAIDKMHQRQGQLDGLATGFTDLDKMTGGLHGGEFLVIAALPGVGKTSLAMNIAEHVLLELHKPVGVFTLEMSATSLVTRVLCSRARVNLRNVREGFMAERDFPKLTGAASKLANSKMFFDDSSDLTAFQFRAKARRMRQEHKIELVVLDYLQLLTAPGKRSESNRQQEVADISRTVKATARELGIPVLAMSQVNDDGQLRESRAIGQDADFVGLLDPEDSEENENYNDAQPYWLRIKKQRNGPTGKVALTFLKGYTRFESAAKVSDEDYPQQ